MIKNNNVKIMGIIATVLLLIIVITASFAYFGSFNVNLINNVAVNINSTPVGNGTFISNATQLNLQVPAQNMSAIVASNEIEAASNTATLSVSLTSGSDEIETTCTFDIYYEYTGSNFYGVSSNAKTSGADKEITMTVNAPSGTSNFSEETNFDYNTSNGWTTENNVRKVKLVENASISNYGTTATTQEYKFTGKYYNLNISQEQLANKSFTGIIYVSKKECVSKNVASSIGTFNLENIIFSFEKGMTFNDWSSSKYNIYNFNFDNHIYITDGNQSKIYNDKQIENNRQYYFTTINEYSLEPTGDLKISNIKAYDGNIIDLNQFSVFLTAGNVDHTVNDILFSKTIVSSLLYEARVYDDLLVNGKLLDTYGPYIISSNSDGEFWYVDVYVPELTNKMQKVLIVQYLNDIFSIIPIDTYDYESSSIEFRTDSLNSPFIFLIFETS